MSQDQMQAVFPVEFEFVKGEQPTATKFTGWVKQTDTAFDRVTAAIGDLWEYQQHSGSGGTYNLSPSRIAQTSLARFGGPSDYVGPRGASFQESITSAFSILLPPYKNTWSLGFPLVKLSSALIPSDTGSGKVTPLVWATDITVTQDAGGVLTTEKSDATEVTAAGDFHVDYYKGVLTTYSRPTSFLQLSIDNMHMFGPGVPWGTANVIPSWEQSTNLCAVTEVSSGGGTTLWNVALPQVDDAPRKTASGALVGAPVEFDQPTGISYSIDSYGETALHRMPYALTSALSDGDGIPEGYMYLWDEDTGRIMTQLTFYYKDENNVRVQGPTGWLTLGNTVRLLLTGTSLAEAVHYLMTTVRENRHVGLTAGQLRDTLSYGIPISHDHLSDTFTGELPSSVTDPERYYFRTSSYPVNPHPQYLHRAGYMENDLVGNTANAMRGWLAFASQADNFPVGTEGLDTSTYGLIFGGGSVDSIAGNPRLAFEGGTEITTWTAQQADRYGFNIVGVSSSIDFGTMPYGALTYTPWYGTPLYLRGRDLAPFASGSDYCGAMLGFDLKRRSEMNYVKLYPGYRNASLYGAVNQPANTSQSGWGTALDITPDLSNRLSDDQVREFRFRGVPYVSDASNDGLGASSTEFAKYFTSPGMVGADFLNVYSNAIFFSEEGDGRGTSFTANAYDWLHSGNMEPVGLYYKPNYLTNHGAFQLVVADSDGTRHNLGRFGNEAGTLLASDSYIGLSSGNTLAIIATNEIAIRNNTSLSEIVIDSSDSGWGAGSIVAFTMTAPYTPGVDDIALFAGSNIYLETQDGLNVYARASYGSEPYTRLLMDTDSILLELKDSSGDARFQTQSSGDMNIITDQGNIVLSAANGRITLSAGGAPNDVRISYNMPNQALADYPRALYIDSVEDGGDGRIHEANSSTLRKKRNVKDMAEVSWLYDLRPVNFQWKKDHGPSDRVEYGLIAEEVEKINNRFVGHDRKGRPSYIPYEKLIPVLLKAIQDQKKEIDELKAQANKPKRTYKKKTTKKK